MSYQTPDIWKEHQGQFGLSWRASWDEVEAVYPELIKNLDKVNGATYDDGAKYRYKVTYKPGYDFTIWRNQKSGKGNFNRPRQFQTTQQQTQQPTQQQNQTTLNDNQVEFQEEVLRLLQELTANVKVIMEQAGTTYFTRATDIKNDHGNEQGGNNASGTGIDTLNAVTEVDDGILQPDTPTGAPDIDSVLRAESEST